MHQCPQTLPRCRIPDPDKAIASTGSDQGAIANEVDPAYGVRMGGKRAHDATATDVPEEDCFIVRAAGKHVAVGGDGEGGDIGVMAEERVGEAFALGERPEGQ